MDFLLIPAKLCRNNPGRIETLKPLKLFPPALIFVALASHLNAQSLTNSLIFYAPFSNSLNDVRGGRVGTGAGGASLQPTGGASGGYLRLVNSPVNAEQYVFYSDPTPATGDFSFAIWVRGSDPQNQQAWADPAIAANKDWSSGGNVGWVLAREDNASDQDKFQWNLNTVGGARKDLDPVGNSKAIIFTGTWHHLAVTHQRNGNATFYRDGEFVASVDISPNAGQSVRPPLGTWITNNLLALGQDGSLRYDHATGTGVTSFNGDLDEAALWTRVLSAADVFNAFAKGTNGLGLDAPLPPGMVQSPQGGTRYVSENFSLSCLASGDPSPSLQWYKGVDLLPGATNSQLLLTNLSLADAGSYTVVATGSGLSVTSSPALLVVQPLPPTTGTIADVRHVVIFMQENRSFDHYFGSLKGVRGFGDRNALLFQNQKTDFYQPQSSSYVLPFHITEQCLSDLNHDWTSGHLGWHLGKWDQWIAAKGTSTMSFYNRADLAFYYALVDAFTICDDYHCSVMGPTNPNRLYLWTGTVDPGGLGGGPVTDNTEPAAGFTWTTYPERLEAAGISWKVYQQADNFDDNALAWFAQYKNAAPGSPLYDRGMAQVADLVSAFQADVTGGSLPRVSWIIAPAALSEHPAYSPASGQLLTKQLLNALASSALVYNSTVFILNYDEDGGLFDHMPSPVPPGGTTNEFVNGLPIGLGVRVPLILVSPWTRGGYVCSQVFDHTSVLRFLETWTGVLEPNISPWRRQTCGDLTAAFDFKAPRNDFPILPNVTAINCPGGNTPSVPSVQTFPTQETGSLIARPLPYQPNANSYTDCGAGRFYITMTNGGAASVHFAIYPNAYRTDGPYPYDVAANNTVTDYFSVVALGGGFYDLSCYGPNGFQRRFAGNVNSNCNQIEVTSTIDPIFGGLHVTLRNSSSSAVAFTVTNGYPTGGPWFLNVPAGTLSTTNFLADDNGWYDLTATAAGYPGFLRRLAGHIEPVAPKLSAVPAGNNLQLIYPDWANGFTVESRTNLASGSWAAVAGTPVISSNHTLLTITNLSGAAFFRLNH